MWIDEKRLEYPVNIKTPNAKLAKVIISQLGGPDGELSASTRYLSQRYTMPDRKLIGMLTDIGTEEIAPNRIDLKTTISMKKTALISGSFGSVRIRLHLPFI